MWHQHIFLEEAGASLLPPSPAHTLYPQHSFILHMEITLLSCFTSFTDSIVLKLTLHFFLNACKAGFCNGPDILGQPLCISIALAGLGHPVQLWSPFHSGSYTCPKRFLPRSTHDCLSYSFRSSSDVTSPERPFLTWHPLSPPHLYPYYHYNKDHQVTDLTVGQFLVVFSPH